MQILSQFKKPKFIISALSLLLAVLSLLTISPQNVKAVPEPGIYLTTDALNLRAGPGTSYEVVDKTVIPRNSSITIEGFSDNYKWGQTSYNGKTGWVSMDYVVRINTGSSTSPEIGKTPEEIVAEITSVYSIIRARRGRSYSGWCGQYVKDQLNQMRIGYYGSGSLNGNKWLTTLVTDGITSYGYKQVKYYGKTCLDDILDANGGVAYNVVISFKAFRSSSGYYNPYGHVLLINAIIDDMVYYSESFSMDRGKEGEPQVYSLKNFTDYYYGYFGDPIGAIHMTQGTTLKPTSGTKIENVASAQNITIVEKNGSADYENAPVTLHSSLGSSERQVFHFDKVNSNGIFTIRPESSETKVLTVGSGGSLVLSEYKKEASQEWYFHILDKANYRYVIRSKSDPDLVLTAEGTSDNPEIILSKYASGSVKQIWKIPTGQNLSSKIQEMSISPEKIEIATDATMKLEVSFFPSFAANTTFEWKSDDESIVTVKNGVIFGKKKGSTIVRATLADGTLYAICTVTVKDELTLIGDANKDNVVNLLDFNIVTRYVNGDITDSGINIKNADVNRDGKIDQKDLDEYIKYFSGDTSCELYKMLGAPQ